MAKREPLVASLLDRISRANHASQRRLTELRAHEYPARLPIDFLSLLQRLHDENARTLESMRSSATRPDRRNGEDEITVRRYGHLVYYLHSLLEIVDEARFEYVSQSAVILVRQLSRDLGGVKFLVIPRYDYNFSYEELLESLRPILRDAFRNPAGAAEPVLKQVDDFGSYLAILRFPYAERNSILLNAMLAHEVGHAVSRRDNLVESVITAVQVDQKVVDLLVREVEDAIKPPGKAEVTLPEFFEKEKIRTRLLEIISATVARWTDELLCDAMAFASLGPVYFLSFAEFILSLEDLDDSSESHPPARMRLSLLLGMMERHGFTAAIAGYVGPAKDVFDSVHRRIQDIQAKVDQPTATKATGPFGVATNAVRQLTDTIAEHAKKAAGTAYYEPAKLIRDIPAMCELLSVFVPPCVLYDIDGRRMVPSELISILNAGACFSVARLHEIHRLFGAEDADKRLEVDAKFESLVAKAIELSYTYSMMETERNRTGS